MALEKLQALLNDIFTQGEQLCEFLEDEAIQKSIEVSDDTLRGMKRAKEDFLAVRRAYQLAPVGFTEIFENAQALIHSSDQVIKLVQSTYPAHEIAKQASYLLKTFRDKILRARDVHFASTTAKAKERSKLDTEILAQMEFFKFRLTETQQQLEKQEKQSVNLDLSVGALKSQLIETRTLSDELKNNITNKLQEAAEFLNTKQEEINQLVGNMAAKSLVGSYEQSAAIEKSTADNLRTAALVFMALVVAMVAKTFWEISSDGFEWDKSVIRLVCTILFSVPAAYLARESAKHRQQQYTHLQTALDLKAIGPYLATLPKDRQDELKAEMAQKIFAQKTFDHITKESYPINSQELILALFDKVNERKKKEKSTDSGGEAD